MTTNLKIKPKDRLFAAIWNLSKKLWAFPTDKELAKELELTPQRVDQLMGMLVEEGKIIQYNRYQKRIAEKQIK